MIREIAGKRVMWLGLALIAASGIYLIFGVRTPEKTIATKTQDAHGVETVNGEKPEILNPENYREKIKASKSVLVMWYHGDFDGRAPFFNEDGMKYMGQLKKDLGSQPECYYLLDIAKFKKPWETLKKETNDVFHPCFVLYKNGEVVNVTVGSPGKDKWDEELARDKECILKSLQEKMGAK